MSPDDVALPDPDEIGPHAIAFARMMFAHAALEREVGSLVDAINPEEPGFGERPENQWTASVSGMSKIVSLIIQYHGSGLPQTEQIKSLLNDAIRPCRDRNLITHGTWCCFNRRNLTVEVRGEVRSEQPEPSPETNAYTVSDILKVALKFKDIEAELHRIRRSLGSKIVEAGLFRARGRDTRKASMPDKSPSANPFMGG